MNYRDIVVRLGVAGTSSFIAQLNAAATAVEGVNKRIVASGRTMDAQLWQGALANAEKTYDPYVNAGKRALNAQRLNQRALLESYDEEIAAAKKVAASRAEVLANYGRDAAGVPRTMINAQDLANERIAELQYGRQIAEARYGPIVAGGERAATVLRAQSIERVAQLKREVMMARDVAGNFQAAYAMYAQGPTGKGPFLPHPQVQLIADNAVKQAETALSDYEIREAATASRVTSIRQTLYRAIATTDGKIALADRNMAKERLAVAEAEEARLLAIYSAGSAAITAEVGKHVVARDVAPGGTLAGATTQSGSRLLRQGDLLSATNASRKLEASIAATRGEITAMSEVASARLPAMGGLWAKQANLIRTNATAARNLGYSFLAMGAVSAIAIGESIKHLSELDRDIHNVLSITDPGVAGANYNKMFDAILSLSTKVPQSADELGKALYEIASAGKFGADGLALLKVSAIGASAGLATTQEAAVALISVLNAYGMPVGSASKVMDILFQTVRVGIITFHELTQQLGDFVAFGAIAKIPLEDLGVALATITRAGVPAAEASTSLNRVIQAFIKPSQAMTKELNNIGFSSGAAFLAQRLTTDQATKLNAALKDGGSTMRVTAGSALGLVKGMEVLRVETGGNVVQLQQLFKEIRAARGAYALMSANGQTLAMAVHDFGDATSYTGSTVRALNEQAKSMSYQWKLTKNDFAAVGMSLARDLMPAITDILKGLQSMGKAFMALPGWMQAAIGISGALATMIVLLGGSFLVIAPRITRAKIALDVLNVSERATAVSSRVLMASLGFLGVALAIGGAILASHASNVAKDTDAIDAHVQAMQADADASDTSLTQLKKQIAGELQHAGTLDLLNKLNLDGADAVDAILGHQKAYADFEPKVIDYIIQEYKAKGDWLLNAAREKTLRADLDGAMHGNAAAAQRLRDNWEGMSKSLTREIESVVMIGTEVNRNKDSLKAFSQQTKAAGTAADDASAGVDKLSAAQKELAKTLAGFADTGDIWKNAQAAVDPIVSAYDVYKNTLSADQKSLNAEAKAQAKSYNAALKASSQAAQDSARSTSQSAQRSLSMYTKVSKGTRQAYRDMTNAAKDHAREVTRANADARKSSSDFQRKASVFAGEYATSLEKQTVTQKKYLDDLDTLYNRHVPTGFIDELKAKGADAADLVHILANANDHELGRITKAYTKLQPSVGKSLAAFQRELHQQLDDMVNFQKNLAIITARGQIGLATSLYGMGAAAAGGLAKQLAKASDKTLADIGSTKDDLDALAGSAKKLDDRLTVIGAIARAPADKIDLKQIATDAKLPLLEVAGIVSTLGKELDSLPNDVKVRVKAYVSDTQVIDDQKNIKDKIRTQVTSDYETAANAINVKVSKHKVSPQVAGAMRDVAKEVASTSLHTQMTALDTQIKAAQARLKREADSHPLELKVDADPNEIDSQLDLNRTRYVHLSVIGPDGKQVDASYFAPKNAKAEANGGVLEFFARGGIKEHHVAQIAPAGAMRVWAEPETGGEAYIPLHPSKRLRSGAILEDVADRFGYKLMKFVDGGFSAPYGAYHRVPGVGMGGYGMGQPIVNVTVQGKAGPTTYDNGVHISHMEVRPLDFNETIRQADRRRRRANMAGGVKVPRV